MTETYTGRTPADDIDTDADIETARLDAAADALLVEEELRTFEKPRPLRSALREDAQAARDWSRERAVRLRGAVEEEPVKATLYALGIGVLIGLLAAR